MADHLELSFALVAEVEMPGVREDDLASLAASVLSAEGAAGAWDVTVALVDDARLQALHRDFMGVDEPTDIMTFPAGNGAPGGGDLVISADHARTQSTAWGFTPEEEVRFLVVHGLLHLLGWRDEREEERERMLARQRDLLDGWRQASN